MKNSDATVFVIDDDASVCTGLARLMRSVGLKVETFASAREFLDHEIPYKPGCLILDIRLPGLSGLELQEELAAGDCCLPIIFITGHGSVPLSVRAMKAGAVDFLEKPFEDQALIDAVHQAIEQANEALRQQSKIRTIRQHLTSLTAREREVFALVVTGMLNKQMASQLGTSEKTIKVHRARVMQKMQARSLADLVRMAAKVDFHRTKG